GVAAPLEVHRQLARDLPRPLTVRLLQTMAHASMQIDAPSHRQPRVQRLAVQRVLEREAAGHGAVGPLLVSGGVDELLATRDVVTPRLHLAVRERGSRRDGRRRERSTDDARHLEQTLREWIEAVELALD